MPDYDPDDFDDPRHPDHDLSESGIRVHRDYDKPLFLRRPVIVAVGVVLILALLLPLLTVL